MFALEAVVAEVVVADVVVTVVAVVDDAAAIVEDSNCDIVDAALRHNTQTLSLWAQTLNSE